MKSADLTEASHSPRRRVSWPQALSRDFSPGPPTPATSLPHHTGRLTPRWYTFASPAARLGSARAESSLRYFVTGATGFIGGYIARQLVEAGHEVVALARDPARAARLRALGR